eukprot:TRINITY_DN50577_c0_g1_i1.p1 TRINITY_DN50577_c0_g1~~TRINITY_DN50577_c0_g1_i1.p1  ORF type:complete len:698 (+),score=98.67 TRINITY_DN50577_c0_g1_i1:107-2200(+)
MPAVLRGSRKQGAAKEAGAQRGSSQRSRTLHASPVRASAPARRPKIVPPQGQGGAGGRSSRSASPRARPGASGRCNLSPPVPARGSPRGTSATHWASLPRVPPPPAHSNALASSSRSPDAGACACFSASRGTRSPPRTASLRTQVAVPSEPPPSACRGVSTVGRPRGSTRFTLTTIGSSTVDSSTSPTAAAGQRRTRPSSPSVTWRGLGTPAVSFWRPTEGQSRQSAPGAGRSQPGAVNPSFGFVTTGQWARTVPQHNGFFQLTARQGQWVFEPVTEEELLTTLNSIPNSEECTPGQVEQAAPASSPAADQGPAAAAAGATSQPQQPPLPSQQPAGSGSIDAPRRYQTAETVDTLIPASDGEALQAELRNVQRRLRQSRREADARIAKLEGELHRSKGQLELCQDQLRRTLWQLEELRLTADAARTVGGDASTTPSRAASFSFNPHRGRPNWGRHASQPSHQRVPSRPPQPAVVPAATAPAAAVRDRLNLGAFPWLDAMAAQAQGDLARGCSGGASLLCVVAAAALQEVEVWRSNQPRRREGRGAVVPQRLLRNLATAATRSRYVSDQPRRMPSRGMSQGASSPPSPSLGSPPTRLRTSSDQLLSPSPLALLLGPTVLSQDTTGGNTAVLHEEIQRRLAAGALTEFAPEPLACQALQAPWLGEPQPTTPFSTTAPQPGNRHSISTVPIFGPGFQLDE